MLINLYVKSVVALDQFRKDERGVTAIEYAVVAVAVAGLVVAVFSDTGTLQTAIKNAFDAVGTKIGEIK